MSERVSARSPELAAYSSVASVNYDGEARILTNGKSETS
jgi:hypothetical protein